MLLSELIPQAAGDDVEISGLASDSREVRPGYLFAALAGTRASGADFIPDAAARGAAAVLAPEGTDPALAAGAPLVTDPNPRRRLALVAARFYGAQPVVVACVTGTNGKTSVAEFTRQIWRASGRRAAALGTLGACAEDGRQPLRHTTPDPVTLHRVLAGLAAGRHRPCGAGGVQSRPRPAPARRGSRRCGSVHDLRPRSHGLSQ